MKKAKAKKRKAIRIKAKLIGIVILCVLTFVGISFLRNPKGEMSSVYTDSFLNSYSSTELLNSVNEDGIQKDGSLITPISHEDKKILTVLSLVKIGMISSAPMQLKYQEVDTNYIFDKLVLLQEKFPEFYIFVVLEQEELEPSSLILTEKSGKTMRIYVTGKNYTLSSKQELVFPNGN